MPDAYSVRNTVFTQCFMTIQFAWSSFMECIWKCAKEFNKSMFSTLTNKPFDEEKCSSPTIGDYVIFILFPQSAKPQQLSGLKLSLDSVLVSHMCMLLYSFPPFYYLDIYVFYKIRDGFYFEATYLNTI